MADATVTWLTQEAFDRLNAELEHLTGAGRTEIAKKIEAAREEGDLKENGGYHAAKDEQGKIEARIRLLTPAAPQLDGRRGAREPRRRRVGHRRHRQDRSATSDVPARQPRDRRRRATSTSTARQPARHGDPRPEGRRQSPTRRRTARRSRSRSSRSRPTRVVWRAARRRDRQAQKSTSRLEAVVAQPREHQLGVLGAAGLDVQLEFDLADLQAAVVAGVQHLDDVRVGLGDELGDAGELAGAVGQRDAQLQVALRRGETAADDRSIIIGSMLPPVSSTTVGPSGVTSPPGSRRRPRRRPARRRASPARAARAAPCAISSSVTVTTSSTVSRMIAKFSIARLAPTAMPSAIVGERRDLGRARRGRARAGRRRRSRPARR